ncbi:hypothetical protein GCK72_023386 [Caenorhabditis remanei]|uniref:histone acetyltransferase n=1 Tax=Caenorhabditis remanei TaxID=31234 RepID=A0A6A5FWC0_CAERE|nr:hypothetical protein GCK72_023386 [Caenorhabditis remanei]KAF1746928.1 hypothetical protein GCK72_023386 [Caenorhabditis remanei]
MSDSGTEFPLQEGTNFLDLERMLGAAPRSQKIFEDVMKAVSKKNDISPEALTKLEQTAKKEDEMAVLPEAIQLASGPRIQSVYGSPFPSHLFKLKTVFVCDYCMQFFDGQHSLSRHRTKGCLKGPPGVEIYRKEHISIFQVNGHLEKNYCHNVCLVSRLFLNSKTIIHQTEHFMFYVLTVCDEHGYKFAGYFSKEMYWPHSFTMLCLMVLPSYRSQGLGRILIALSYAMARREGKLNSPETPLSADGKFAHEQYWMWAICNYLHEKSVFEKVHTHGISLAEISIATGINCHDVLRMVGEAGWLDLSDPPNEKGVHIPKLNFNWDFISETVNKEHLKCRTGKPQFDESCLHWQEQKITPEMNGFDNYEGKGQDIGDIETEHDPSVPSASGPVELQGKTKEDKAEDSPLAIAKKFAKVVKKNKKKSKTSKRNM